MNATPSRRPPKFDRQPKGIGFGTLTRGGDLNLNCWVSTPMRLIPESKPSSRKWRKRLKEGTAMKVLVYKQTHSGDPDERTGVWGVSDCMGRIRSWPYDAVIGVGGASIEAKDN